MKYNIVDGHCDTPMELYLRQEDLQDNTCQVSLSRAQTLAGYVQFYAFCTVWLDKRTSFEQHYEAALSYFDRQLDKHAGSIVRCRTEADARAAIAGGKCGAFLSIEGAEAISCDPGKLELAYEQGVRMIAPCWNAPNALTGSIVSGGGLTAQGREFVRRAQKLGILLDVSHISEKAFWDLCDITEKPFVASHSNSRAVCRHVRNLTDEQFKALCQIGGTAGLNLYGAFLKDDGPVTFEDVWRHIEHFLELGGEGHIALGGDLDGCSVLPESFTGVDSYELLAQWLEEKHLPAATIEHILCKYQKSGHAPFCGAGNRPGTQPRRRSVPAGGNSADLSGGYQSAFASSIPRARSEAYEAVSRRIYGRRTAPFCRKGIRRGKI